MCPCQAHSPVIWGKLSLKALQHPATHTSAAAYAMIAILNQKTQGASVRHEQQDRNQTKKISRLSRSGRHLKSKRNGLTPLNTVHVHRGVQTTNSQNKLRSRRQGILRGRRQGVASSSKSSKSEYDSDSFHFFFLLSFLFSDGRKPGCAILLISIHLSTPKMSFFHYPDKKIKKMKEKQKQKRTCAPAGDHFCCPLIKYRLVSPRLT